MLVGAEICLFATLADWRQNCKIRHMTRKRCYPPGASKGRRRIRRCSFGLFCLGQSPAEEMERNMIDIETETPISLAQASHRCPPGRGGKKPTLSCLLRWIMQGAAGPRGRVKLEAARIGGRWFTSVQALQRFIERCTPATDEPAGVQRSPTRRQRESERAAAELAKCGI